MGYLYSELVDRAKIVKIIGTDYPKMANVYRSDLLAFEGLSDQGTTEEWIRSQLWEADTLQPVGADSEITLQGETQTLYKVPICWRAGGALLDNIWEEMRAKATTSAETNLTNRVNEAAAQGYDDFFVAILNGYNSYAATNSTNYLNKNGSQITPKIIQETKAKLKENGMKIGTIVCRTLMYYQLGALGMAAYTANTLGAAAQDSLTQTGRVVNDTYLGAKVVMTDKLFNQAGLADDTQDHYISFAIPGAMMAKNARGGVQNMSWQGTAAGDGSITDAQLATSTNWTTAVVSGSEHFIPIAVCRVDVPTFA
jgi:hypothetical protein